MKKLYVIGLYRYDEENVPECCATVFARSDKDLTKMPKHLIKENARVEEALEEFGCEGIGNIFESSEEEWECYEDDFGLIEL